MSDKTPGQQLYEQFELFDEPHLDPESLNRFWRDYTTATSKRKWELIHAGIVAPLLAQIAERDKRIEELEARVDDLKCKLVNAKRFIKLVAKSDDPRAS